MNKSGISPFIVGLLVLQAVISVSLWVVNPLSVDSTTGFAFLIAADVLIFGAICHTYFFTDQEEADMAATGTPSTAEATVHDSLPPEKEPIFDMPPVTSRRLRIAVPALSVLMLITLASLVASGRGTTDVFIPIFLAMVVVYVFASIYLFKMIIEKEKVSTGAAAPSTETPHESH